MTPFLADVLETHGGDRWLVRLRGAGRGLFARQEALQALGAEVGSRLLLDTDFETIAADVLELDATGLIDLQLAAPFEARTRTIALRRPTSGKAPKRSGRGSDGR